MSEQEPFRLRVAYAKRGRLRYLGHLEVLRTVERSVRRAGLPYAVTQGFSPHMRIAFSAALPVGTASRAEFYDLYLDSYVPADEALARLAGSTPADLAPTAAAYVGFREPALTAALTRATYEVRIRVADAVEAGEGDVSAALAETASLECIEYLRAGKKLKRMDLARTLVSAEARLEGGVATLALDTRSSNDGALRPEVLIRELERRLAARLGDPEARPFSSVRIERTSQSVELKDGSLASPLPERPRRAGRASAENV